MDTLKEDLKKQIIEQLNLEDVQISDIGDDTLLFSSEGLGLDSIDALELIVLMEHYHGVLIVDPKEGKEVFLSVTTMADYIRRKKSE